MAKTIKEERLRWVLPIINKEVKLVNFAKVCPYGKRSLERWVATYKVKGEAGLESIEGKEADLTEFFDLRRVPKNGHFAWQGIRFELIQVVHIMAERIIKHSYGLMMREGKGKKVFWTSDTQFCPNQIKKFYDEADVILHDCETGPKSGVHAHYDELITLSVETKKKMFLYHYQPDGPRTRKPIEDGFLGFVRKGNSLVVRGSHSARMNEHLASV